MTVDSGEINLQSKHDLICHVTKVKAATSSAFHDRGCDKTKRKHFIHIKVNNIRNIFRTLMFNSF